VRQDPVRDLGIELVQPLFGQTDVRPEDPVGVREANGTSTLLCRDPTRERHPSDPCRRKSLEGSMLRPSAVSRGARPRRRLGPAHARTASACSFAANGGGRSRVELPPGPERGLR
jgi:hypothetical protein